MMYVSVCEFPVIVVSYGAIANEVCPDPIAMRSVIYAVIFLTPVDAIHVVFVRQMCTRSNLLGFSRMRNQTTSRSSSLLVPG